MGSQRSIARAPLTAVRLGALALTLASCGGGSPSADGEPAAPGGPPSVVLILVDTLRADHLGAYGYRRPTSPNLDRLAAQGVLFEQARSQGTCTFPSANSILTGIYPQRFMGQEAGDLGIPSAVPTLASRLRAIGYATFAVSASPIVRKTPSSVNLVGGFDAGFDVFDESCLDRDASCVTARGLELAAEASRSTGVASPYFLFLHYMDPHAPYRAPAGDTPRFAGDYDGPAHIAEGDPMPIAAALRAGEAVAVGEGDMAHLRDRYDEEIAWLDASLGELLAGVDRDRGPDGAAVVLLSDHGEEFYEHQRVVHCERPFDTLVRTPLVLRLPDGPRGKRIEAPVGNIDVVPTLLAYLGAGRALGAEGAGAGASLAGGDGGGESLALAGLEGESLLPLIAAPEGDDGATAASSPRHVFSSHAIWRGVSDGRYKLIWNMDANLVSLYDTGSDPVELQALESGPPGVRRRLRRSLGDWIDRTETGTPESRTEEAERLERHLRASGYLK